METFLVIASAVLGLIVGSALSVQVTRTRTGANLGKRSRCLSCGHVLSARELVPLGSFLWQRGKCKHCKAPISVFYPAIELVTAIAFAGVMAAFLWLAMDSGLGFVFWATIILWWIIAGAMVFLGAYDIRHLKLHTRGLYVLVAAGVLLGLFGAWTGSQVAVLGIFLPQLLLARVVCACIAALFLLGIWKLSNGTWFGSGDIPVLVLSVFLFGFAPAFSVLALAAWVAVVWVGARWLSQVLVHRKLSAGTIARRLPFLPFLFIGMYLVGVWGLHVFGMIGGTL